MPTLQSWLDSDLNRRNIFVIVNVRDVVGATEITKYLSNCHYITDDSVTIFDPIISGNFAISESISLDGGYSISFGDIELFNNDGEYDSWLDPTQYIWANRRIEVYVGDSTWEAADISDFTSTFHMIFKGVVEDLDCKSLTRLAFKIRDRQQDINAPVIEETMDTTGTWNGEQPNKDAIKPLVFGEVHNIEPILIDPATLKYRFSTGASEGVIEIRDNGVPIYTYPSLTTGASINLTDSTFTLTYPPAGQITASIQGRKRSINLTSGVYSNTYVNNPANIIAVICTEYGKTGVTNLSVSDLDLPSFSDIQTSAGYPVGIYLGTQKQNIIEVCKQLADSVGAQLFFNRYGKLQLVRVGTYISGISSVDITENDILRNSLSISLRTVPTAATKLAYCKNWTVQTGILTGIPDEHKEMFASEWYYTTISDSGVKTSYKLHGEVEAKETLLLTTASAEEEAERLNNLNKYVKTVVKFTGKANLLSLVVGQQVRIYHHRFNLSSGKYGQIISATPDWSAGKTEIEVLI